jgi:hypothetical protein
MHRPAVLLSVHALLCEHNALRQLRNERRLSWGDDNCEREIARVNSISLKGITVERRRRKASGPTAQGRRIAGLPAETSSRSICRHLRPFFPICASSIRRLASSPRDEARVACNTVARCSSQEQRKLKRANPPKGGDAKPPVYGISSRFHDSGAAAWRHVGQRHDSCVDRRFLRGRVRACSQASDLSLLNDECVFALKFFV